MPDAYSEAIRAQYKDGTNLSARVRLHARFSTNHYGIFRWIFDRIAVAGDARILELGSGTAVFWTQNAERIPRGWRATLSDFSAGMIAEARTRLSGVAHHFDFLQSDAQTLPFRAERFDAVIANHMLYHVRDIPRALDEIRRVLAPGGRCYAATLGIGHMRELDEIVRRFTGRPLSMASSRFGLENGYEMMHAAFSSVDLQRYPDSLIVTEAQPLIDYFESTSMRSRASDNQRAALTEFIATKLAVEGSIRISKYSGLLIGAA